MTAAQQTVSGYSHNRVLLTIRGMEQLPRYMKPLQEGSAFSVPHRLESCVGGYAASAYYDSIGLYYNIEVPLARNYNAQFGACPPTSSSSSQVS